MKVVFMGSSEFSLPAFEALVSADSYDVVAVYTKAPKPAGRGYALTKTPVHICAEGKGIPVRSPVSLRAEGEESIMAEYAPDVIVVVSYGLMLPKWTLTASRMGCVNIHPSLLPRWRGAAPMQHAILSGDTVTGVTIMQINEFMDAGDIYLQEVTEIGEKENILDLSRRLSVMGSRMLLKVLDSIGSIQPIKQDESGVTIANKLEEFRIDFEEAADVICRRIRALYPKMYFMLDGSRVRVLEAESYEFAEMNIGDVINKELHIRCGGNTALVPLVVQQESKKPCDIRSFLCRFRGKSMPVVS
ncbi:methionyl-tRNA formyltransferase [Anaplasma phagocytophilum str. MRK]|uniref:methionyl-tRNA formyltransferase n=1 Tax=Anaplasma phagocytophilum TaxID=948 RepID=UPI000533A076|nr:methionyl-tRNA formyltransferase [Anaplasma phagocytophilum]KDB56071.1 methionyl-tRNA formyltransferase [Anaplasma phagocytophilum str. MRK]